jgi:hypothetical protein
VPSHVDTGYGSDNPVLLSSLERIDMKIKNKKSLALWTGTVRRHTDASDRLIEEVVLHLREKSNMDKQIPEGQSLLEGKQARTIEEGTPEEDVLLVIRTANKDRVGPKKLAAAEVAVSTDTPNRFRSPGQASSVTDFTTSRRQTAG